MKVDPCIPNNCSITEATLRAYALQVIASESLREFPEIASLPLETRLQEDLGICIEGRLRIVANLRNAFGYAWAAPDLVCLLTLGQLMQSIAPQAVIIHV